MSVLKVAAKWAAKQVASTLLSEVGRHTGEGIGNVIKRKIDPPPPKEEKKDELAKPKSEPEITDAELVP